MILSDRDIIQAISNGDIKISPLVEDFIQPASIDLTLASTIRTFSLENATYVDIKKIKDYSQEVDLRKDGHFFINPNDFLLGATVEKITLPNYLAAKIDGRSSLARLGLMIQASASYVAPGFSGNLTLEIKNISQIPVKLYVGMRIAQIIFEVMSSPSINPYGSLGSNHKYQNQQKPTPSKLWQDFKDS
jgi:dCTP deaminase